VTPRPSPLLSEDQRDFAESVRRFAKERLADPAGSRARDASGEFWRDGWDRCAALGLCGLPVPSELGGGGADRLTVAAALEALGYGCDDAGLVFSINAHLWSSVVPIWLHGSEDQQRRYLPRLCSGEWVGAHAMTEPGSGSDAFGLSTVAERREDGFVLRGRKALITNAPVADLLVVFARAPQTEGALGISAFLVEAGAPGLSVEAPAVKLGLRTSPMAELVLDDVALPADAVLGRAGRAAGAFATAMEWERLLIMAGQLGALERALEGAVSYARERTQFGQPIAGFQAVADKLVDTRVALDAARALLYETAWRYDHGERDPAPAAAVKLLASETVLARALELLQVHGGHGYTAALPYERFLRDAVGGRLYSGTSELMRRIVAGSMGL
jgi:alkylation response protein AidB-like acyl-CoA dehydrogenase